MVMMVLVNGNESVRDERRTESVKAFQTGSAGETPGKPEGGSAGCAAKELFLCVRSGQAETLACQGSRIASNHTPASADRHGLNHIGARDMWLLASVGLGACFTRPFTNLAQRAGELETS